jgi:hypothetical protein
MKYLSEAEKRHWDQIKKQFPYQYKGVDMVIALCGGVTIGLWFGVLVGLAI